MPKNVLIFSDGTGQAGGFRFDEDRSNIYKLYRAARCGPDSAINPSEQVAFYDPGLGSQADGGHLSGRLLRWVYNVISQATGFGITANIVDCYAALIRLWQPGDRIFLFGFSRGAYTVRCLAGVIAHCGIPTRRDADRELLLDPSSTHALAKDAVKHIYQFTSSRKLASATPRQQFLLETRRRLAEQFRAKCGCEGEHEGTNGAPHFLGVFDTVASLGSWRKTSLFATAFLLSVVGASLAISTLRRFADETLIGHFLRALSFGHVFGAIIGLSVISALAAYVFTHVKFDFGVPGYGWREKLRTVHLTELYQKFYDTNLSPCVAYAKHAISIDENRKDFQRVPWGSKKLGQHDRHGNPWFEQVWFAGNHSDIGGSYPENESRLSDITLNWMLKSASVIPDGLNYDPDVLKLYPDPTGVQHDEVKCGWGLLTTLFGLTWAKKYREPAENAIMHRSVYKRFDLARVQVFDRLTLYRPEPLGGHVDFARFYPNDAPTPACSADNPKCDAAEPGERPATTSQGEAKQ
jgi:uncharacterized protein (DUF2235 family)